MKVREKQEWTLLTVFDILSGSRDIYFKGPKHDTQNWFTANNNNGENYDVIRFTYWSLSKKINYNSIITESNPLKL